MEENMQVLIIFAFLSGISFGVVYLIIMHSIHKKKETKKTNIITENYKDRINILRTTLTDSTKIFEESELYLIVQKKDKNNKANDILLALPINKKKVPLFTYYVEFLEATNKPLHKTIEDIKSFQEKTKIETEIIFSVPYFDIAKEIIFTEDAEKNIEQIKLYLKEEVLNYLHYEV
jgi:hypothetical protein